LIKKEVRGEEVDPLGSDKVDMVVRVLVGLRRRSSDCLKSKSVRSGYMKEEEEGRDVVLIR